MHHQRNNNGFDWFAKYFVDVHYCATKRILTTTGFCNSVKAQAPLHDIMAMQSFRSAMMHENRVQSYPGTNFIELLSSTICLASNFSLDKNRMTYQTSICCILLVTGIQLLFVHTENHVEIWSAILFLSGQTFHAKQICVLSSSMKLGPDK